MASRNVATELTVACIIWTHDKARVAGADMSLWGIHTLLITATVVNTALALSTTPLPRLILKISTVVFGVAYKFYRDTLFLGATVKFCFRITFGNT